MKAKIEAGAEFDFLTKDEMNSVLQDWLTEIKRGVRFVRRNLVGTADAAGNILAGNAEDQLGPAGSMVWAITRVSVQTTGPVDIYVNDVATSAWVAQVTGPGFVTFDSTGFLLNPLDRFMFTKSGGAAGDQAIVNVQAVELPVQLAWQLLG